jgi:hypothetical protein
MNQSSQFIDASALSSRWGLHPESVRRLIRAGKLPAIRICGRFRVWLDDVIVFETSSRCVALLDTHEAANA